MLKYSTLLCGVLAICLCASSVAQSVNVKSETFRTSDGVTLHYLDAGSGATIVLIPGWTMAADIFDPQINELSKRFRVISLDPRSQGDSDKTPDGNYPERHAQDIKELMQHAQVNTAVLLGWSNGVPDVLSFIQAYGTTNLSGAILVDGFVNVSDLQMKQAMDGMLKMLQIDRPKFTDGFVRSMYESKQSEAYIQHVEQQSLKTPTNTAVVEIYNVVREGDFTPALAKMDKPILYISGERLASQGKLVQTAIPAARVEVFKNVGHAMFVDDPEHFNKVVSDFMDSLAYKPPD